MKNFARQEPLNQTWRIEPEIDKSRQEELIKCLATVPDTKKGIYPFKGIQLSRADLEWLLATHEGRGPVDWSDISQHNRKGVDLRGAVLNDLDLKDLPLARMYGGLTVQEWEYATTDQREMAAVNFRGTTLRRVHLEQADLSGAHLEEANLLAAFMNGAYLAGANFQNGYLRRINLEQAYLPEAHLEGTNLTRALLADAILNRAHLEKANMSEAYLNGALLEAVTLADENRIGPLLADVHWDSTNLAVVDWSQVNMLGDEQNAQETKLLSEYKIAVRANRQLAIALQTQGLNEEAARFAFRAQRLQRKVLWQQQKSGRWLFSMLLSILAGYGYRMWRILIAYAVVISLCAVAYFVLGMYYHPQLSLDQAFLESITAFHGRVFFEQFNPGTPQIWITAFEAVVGLVIEGVFVAMLVQRFFSR